MKFRLASLLRVRALQEESAAADAARAAGEARAARTAAMRRRDALASAHSLDTRSGQLAFAAAVAARSASTHLFTESLTLADAAEGASTLAQAELSAARRRLRALERLAERSRQAEIDEDLRTEQGELDEHASRRSRAGTATSLGLAAIDLDDAAVQCPECNPAAFAAAPAATASAEPELPLLPALTTNSLTTPTEPSR